jgi:hypothetical protein
MGDMCTAATNAIPCVALLPQQAGLSSHCAAALTIPAVVVSLQGQIGRTMVVGGNVWQQGWKPAVSWGGGGGHGARGS